MTQKPENIQELIFGTEKDLRYTQDSPVLPDVWLKYAEEPNQRVVLMSTTHRDVSAGHLANNIWN